MVYLSKHTAPLLRLVKGQPHASDKDHEGTHSESAKSAGEEDVNREPDDSSDEENTGPSYKPPPTAKHVRAPARKYVTTNIHSAPDSKNENNKDYGASKSSGFKRPAGSEPRKQVEEEKYADLTERNVFSGSQEKGKRLKRTFTKKGPSSSQPEAGFQKPKGRSPVKPKTAAEKAPLFRKARGLYTENGSEPSSSQAEASSSGGPTFRNPRGFKQTSEPDSTEASATSRADEMLLGRTSRSSSFSSLTSIESSDVEEVELPKASDYIAKSPCPICKVQVEDSFKLDFEVEHCRGKRMNFRMQEGFCKAHKARAANQVWKDRNYPEIDWSSFHSRMKSHHPQLHAVLDGQVESYYREQLEEKLKSGSTKTAIKGINDDGNTGSGVGYYGGRGERLMIDHIMRAFSDKIRRVAVSSKLMASMGVSGGVSGYVQTVLVPEMAQGLVMEDLGVSAEEARRVIAESSDIGDAVHEEEEEKVPRRVIDLSDAEGEE